MVFRAVSFMAYGQSTALVKGWRNGQKMRPIDWFIAGGIAQGIGLQLDHPLTLILSGAFLEGPIDFYKSQMQIQIVKSKTIPGYVPEFTGVFDAAKKIIKHKGIIAASYQVSVFSLPSSHS